MRITTSALRIRNSGEPGTDLPPARADHDHLHGIEQSTFRCKPVPAGIEAEVLNDVPWYPPARSRQSAPVPEFLHHQPLSRNSAAAAGRISCRRRRVLQRVALCPQCAPSGILPGSAFNGADVYNNPPADEIARCSIMASASSRRCLVILHLSARRPRIDAGIHGKRIIVERTPAQSPAARAHRDTQSHA